MNARLLFLLAFPVLGVGAAEPSAADLDHFEKQVRPVLIDHCFECHGEKKQKGGLRLDSRAAVLAGGDLGPAIVLGKPEASPLITAVQYEDEDMQMPPNRKLSDTKIAALTEWVKRGAVWPGEKTDPAAAPSAKSSDMVFTPEMKGHWAFQAIRKPTLPLAAAHPIDAFLDARITAAGVVPAPPADARTLIRRITFDLTGLPPTPAEVDAYLVETQHADRADSAYEKLVGRLLESPHHGEHWARHWLDVARYADSNGSEVDHAMSNAWRYRDYVVRAFNDDMPFDRFVQEQIAGDLLPGADASTLAATGFLMIGPKSLADLDKPRLIADVVDEQVDTVGRAFMGLTMGCARCHDHKFDPIGDEDYYALAGIFTSTRMMNVSKRVATWTERPFGEQSRTQREALETKLAALRSERDAVVKSPTVEKSRLVLAADAPFLLIEAEQFARGNVRVERDQLGLGIGVVRTRMEYPDHIEYEFELPRAGEYQLEMRYAAKESRPTQLIINGNLEEMDAAAEVTGDWTPKAQRWFVQGCYPFQMGKNLLTFHRDGPVPLFDKLLIGNPSDKPHSRSVKPEPAKSEIGGPTKPFLARLDAEISSTEKTLEQLPMVMAPFDGPVADAPILVRGNPAMRGAIVPRGFPKIVSGLNARLPGPEQSGRLELARWLTHPHHPLTSRVIVNRVWHWHFGQGLVRSPDNFGLRGEKPTHPELLDWLANWFVDNGWSLKKLHALICTSHAYRRASRTGAAVGSDPENLLLAHFPRRRLTAEELRDGMLATSGLLDRTLGGSLMNVLNRTYANGGNAPADVAKQMHYETPRRSIYLPVIRTALHDFFAVFDYPDPGMLTGQRASTTVAPQALFLMNSPFLQAQATAFARRVQALSENDETRLHAAYMMAFARPPSAGEVRGALAFLDGDAAALQTANDQAPRASAWTRLCHALLASNEFLYLR